MIDLNFADCLKSARRSFGIRVTRAECPGRKPEHIGAPPSLLRVKVPRESSPVPRQSMLCETIGHVDLPWLDVRTPRGCASEKKVLVPKTTKTGDRLPKAAGVCDGTLLRKG